ncbi:hypothetical protein FD755_020663 [Muntiacus reevesi]|uniref:Chemokine interleukin-8-like domain-containing protein n=1 Tax=Muntiacus reevesi TaxID=9886 RepID=A0A5N3WZI9_MUNRE|nr:hypothetical protein FD755_020663 [Muntiacus reevesi]
MKVLLAAVFVLLCTVALCSYARERVYTPPTCCFTYISGKIPHRNVVNYFKTSSNCARPSHRWSKPSLLILCIIRLPSPQLPHQKGPICLCNPADSWVQKYIRDLKKSP